MVFNITYVERKKKEIKKQREREREGQGEGEMNKRRLGATVVHFLPRLYAVVVLCKKYAETLAVTRLLHGSRHRAQVRLCVVQTFLLPRQSWK